MDVSDTKIIFELYLTISGMGNSRLELSVDQFKIQLIAILRKKGCIISLINETDRLYTLDEKILLYFSPLEKNPYEIERFLLYVLRTFYPRYIIAYGIRNEAGACIYRVEIAE